MKINIKNENNENTSIRAGDLVSEDVFGEILFGIVFNSFDNEDFYNVFIFDNTEEKHETFINHKHNLTLEELNTYYSLVAKSNDYEINIKY